MVIGLVAGVLVAVAVAFLDNRGVDDPVRAQRIARTRTQYANRIGSAGFERDLARGRYGGRAGPARGSHRHGAWQG
jgi:hypothetical protein